MILSRASFTGRFAIGGTGSASSEHHLERRRRQGHRCQNSHIPRTTYADAIQWSKGRHQFGAGVWLHAVFTAMRRFLLRVAAYPVFTGLAQFMTGIVLELRRCARRYAAALESASGRLVCAGYHSAKAQPDAAPWTCGTSSRTVGRIRTARQSPGNVIQTRYCKRLPRSARIFSRSTTPNGCLARGWELLRILSAREKLPSGPDSGFTTISLTPWAMRWITLRRSTGS